MVIENWWSASPWWAQFLIIFGGFAIWGLMSWLTYLILDKLSVEPGDRIMGSIFWFVTLIIVLIWGIGYIIISICYLPSMISDIKEEIHNIQKEIKELKRKRK